MMIAKRTRVGFMTRSIMRIANRQGGDLARYPQLA